MRQAFGLLGGITTLLLVLSCSSQLSVQDARSAKNSSPAKDEEKAGEETEEGTSDETDEGRESKTNLPSPAIDDLDVLAAKPGETVEVTGKDFHDGMTVEIGGKVVALDVKSPTKATFVMPEGVVGQVDVHFKANESKVASLSLIGYGDDLPVILAPAEQICSDVSYRDAKGKVRQGKRDCGVIEECDQESQATIRGDRSMPQAPIISYLAASTVATLQAFATTPTISAFTRIRSRA